jgi:phosphoribosylformylglycinamidine synthase
MKVKSLVLDGYGLNCGKETRYAIEQGGGYPEKVHITEIISRDKKLEDYQIFVLIGGFSYGDDHGAGVLLANKLKNNIGDDIQQFVDDDKLILGICNGFQTLVNYGLLPGFDGDYNSCEVALIDNYIGNFRDDWTTLKINKKSPCVFTKGIEKIELPIRHAEGKLYAEPDVLDKLLKNNQVVVQYAKGNKLAEEEFPYNPNGSVHDIAGICDSTGNILGVMPHPEAYNSFTNHPDWTRLKEKYKRAGIPIPKEGEGIQMFRNGVRYIEDNFS